MTVDTGRGRDNINLANTITALRFPLAGMFLFAGARGRLGILAAAAASDMVDGLLARRTGRQTRLGAAMDPIADKAFLVTALITIAGDERVPRWTLPLLLGRDIGVAAGAAILSARGVPLSMSARSAGKVVTWLQFVGIGAIAIRPATARWVAPVVGAAGIIALLDYARSIRAGE